MSKWKIVDQSFENISADITADSVEDAALCALDKLGWSLVAVEGEEDGDIDEDSPAVPKKLEDIDTSQMCEELREASDLEGTETGEAWLALVDLWDGCDCTYLVYPGFKDILEEAIREEYKTFKKYFEVIDRVVVKRHSVRVLIPKEVESEEADD